MLSLHTIALAGIVLLSLHLIHTLLLSPLINHLKSRQRACGAVPSEPTKWPLGLDVVLRGLQADKAQRTPDYVEQRFATMGRYTWRVNLLGSSNLITADPRNIQAVLATQFDDFVMGAARKTNLRRVLGRSIFAVDGAAWHGAREVMRPLFSRENVANLRLLGEHFDVMMECLMVQCEVDGAGRTWTAPVSLARLLPCFTLDSATELFLGRSTDSLRERLRREGDGVAGKEEKKKDFTWAFEQVLQLLAVRMRLRGLYWLYGNRELQECVDILHRFVDDTIDAADAAKKQQGGSDTKYDFLESLRARCSDRAEVREQVLGLLAAGRDTTASVTSWVFYCLIRHPRVFHKLRGIVIETFGLSAEEITFEKLKGCTYLQHTLNETLRLHSVVPFNSRRAKRDTTLPTGGGPDGTQPVFVPAGTEVNYSTHVLHRRKDLWGPDADQFVPERWEKRRAGLGSAWHYAPFSGGPRICIGQQLALTEAGYVVVRLLQRFDALEGLDDESRDYHNFTIVCSPGSSVDRDGAVPCRLRVAL